MTQEPIYTLDDVLGLGFEASCQSSDGTRFLWHGTCGLRVGPADARAVLITDSAVLPHEPWFATRWGKQELEEIGVHA